MLFDLSKLAQLALQPSTLCFIVISIGLGLASVERRRVIGIRCATAGLGIMLVLALSPLSSLLLSPLEERFPKAAVTPSPGPSAPVGIIILGGFEHVYVSRARRELALNEAAERLIEGVRLAQRLPDTRVVFTGGTGELGGGEGAADLVGETLIALGVAKQRVVLEEKSRNTAENASMTRDLVSPKSGEAWMLVTSAAHMPRAIGAFRAVGFTVMAWPVDYRTTGSGNRWSWSPNIGAGLMRIDEAVKEWLGLAGYYVTGRSSEWFPAP